MNASHLQEVVYTPESQLRNPGRLLRAMLHDVIASRELAWRLFVRDISAQYRQTALGYVWAIFPPLITSFAFVLLNLSNVITVGKTGIPYPAYVIMGTVFYSLFQDAMFAPLGMARGSITLLIKIKFPHEALILAAMAHVLFKFGIKLVLLVAVLIIFRLPLQSTVLLAPIPVLGLLVMGTMLGVFLVPFGLLFADISHALTVISTGLMFLTPVVYSPPSGGPLAKIITYNPLTPLLMAARDCFVTGSDTYIVSILPIMLLTLGLLLGTWILFRLAVPILVERMGT